MTYLTTQGLWHISCGDLIFHKPKLPLKRKETHRTEWNKEWRLCQSIHHLMKSVCTYQSTCNQTDPIHFLNTRSWYYCPRLNDAHNFFKKCLDDLLSKCNSLFYLLNYFWSHTKLKFTTLSNLTCHEKYLIFWETFWPWHTVMWVYSDPSLWYPVVDEVHKLTKSTDTLI